MSYSDSIFFEDERSENAKLHRAIEQLLPNSVKKILATNKAIIQNEDWDALRVVADIIDQPIFTAAHDEKYMIKYQKKYLNGLNILKQLFVYGAIDFEDYCYPRSIEKFTEKGLIEYVTLCLNYGMRFSFNELMIVCKNIDLDIFKLIDESNFDEKYSEPSISIFWDSPIQMLSVDPVKNTWGKIKNFEDYLENNFLNVNKRVKVEVESLIFKKFNLTKDPKERQNISKKLNEYQKKFYEDRLNIMKGLLKFIEYKEDLLKGKNIDYWKQSVEFYEEDIKKIYKIEERKSKPNELNQLKEVVADISHKNLDKGNITLDDFNVFIKDLQKAKSADEVFNVFLSLFPEED